MVSNWGMLATRWYQKSMLTSKGHFSKTLFFLRKNHVFWDPMDRSWIHTPTKKHSTYGAQDRIHLGIDLLTILLDVWCRVGKQSQPRIDFGTKSQHNPSKDRLQEASRKWSSLGSIFSAHVIPELVCLIPELVYLIPELVWPYSRTRFPYSRTRLVLFLNPNSFGLIPELGNEFGNKKKWVRE